MELDESVSTRSRLTVNSRALLFLERFYQLPHALSLAAVYSLAPMHSH